MIGPAKIEKRNRPPKSCEPCRTRKTDRRADKPESVADRLKTLESLIATVAQKATTSPSLGINDNAGMMASETDSTSRNEHLHNYNLETDTNNSTVGLLGHVDSNHWSSILENIRAIREELPAVSPQTSTLSSVTLNNETSESMDFDMRTSEGLTMQDILSDLPPKQVCDMLVSVLFRSHYAMMPILHPDKFQQEYESFWNSPTETSATWVAILLALLSLTAGIYEVSGQAKTSQVTIPSSKALAKKAEQCLLLSNYTASSEHAVEALLLLLVGCWLRTKVSDTNIWFLMGKVVQLAICKGYHRDATKVPASKISPFYAEMRRRVWVCLYQLDSLMSFQMGVPSMIPSDCCDTELPRNLNQSDFYPGISELPPSRPFTENTAILYSIVKASVMTMFKKVVRHTRSLTPTSHEETVSLDSVIRMVYHNIPEHYKYKPLTSFIVDDVGIITSRTTIDFLYLKSIIVLHRQYLTHPQDDRSEFSRKACLEAAETVLERQVELHQVTQPGGLLHDMKWTITSLTLSDFTLAAMVICLDLTVRMRQAVGATAHHDDETFQKRLAAIERAHQIWASSSETSEARTVTQALESTIERVNEHMNTWQSSVCNTSTTNYPVADSSVQMTDFDMVDSIDWSLLDNQIQDPTIQDFDLDLWLMDTVGPLGL
ncbi:hypothetical protein F53441_7707 [Fusarium austroafricanum]|uniref:Xylanolytic transcriptional activator regulatory domain-containing protein n=1 Tax=Fusarium austroafricanum TaxID=2364996 RepID=A0A8H4NXA5_9HYPO|nr:hypothetical protein F53441_7707 [Fusarium austroafricanum]